jgi:hypothetical protein
MRQGDAAYPANLGERRPYGFADVFDPGVSGNEAKAFIETNRDPDEQAVDIDDM